MKTIRELQGIAKWDIREKFAPYDIVPVWNEDDEVTYPELEKLVSSSLQSAYDLGCEVTMERVREAEKLLKECEPFLSDHSAVAMNAIYIPPAQAMRNAADRMEYEENLKRRVRDFLSPTPESDLSTK